MKQIKKITRLDFVNAAKAYLDVPYVYKGRSKGGMDCAGLLIKTLNSTVLPDYNFLNYGVNPNPKHVRKELLNISEQISEIEYGCLLVLKLHGLGNHIAIYIEDNNLLHTYGRAGKVIVEKYTLYWQKKLDSIYRVRI